MMNFSGNDKHQDVAEQIISNETEYDLVEDSLIMHRTGSNETALVSEIPYIINDENVIMTPRQKKKKKKKNSFNFK